MKKIYVGNLPADSTEDQLCGLFEGYGTVSRVELLYDRFSGEPRGLGFVYMPDAEEAASAIAALDGFPLGENQLKVYETQPREASGSRRMDKQTKRW